MMVFKPLIHFEPQYMYDMFTKNSQVMERHLHNTTIGLRLPLSRVQKNAQLYTTFTILSKNNENEKS